MVRQSICLSHWPYSQNCLEGVRRRIPTSGAHGIRFGLPKFAESRSLSTMFGPSPHSSPNAARLTLSHRNRAAVSGLNIVCLLCCSKSEPRPSSGTFGISSPLGGNQTRHFSNKTRLVFYAHVHGVVIVNVFPQCMLGIAEVQFETTIC